MGDVRLSTPRLVIKREHQDDVEVQTTNADLVLWDKTRFKHKWPKVDEAPFLWLTFLGWAAMRRTGAIPPDHRYEQFEVETLEVEALSDDDERDGDGEPASEYGRPTPAGPEPA